MALHWYIKKKATDFKGFYIFLIAKRAEKDDFSQKSDEDGLNLLANGLIMQGLGLEVIAKLLGTLLVARVFALT